MPSRFVRQVRTASGAVAVQVVTKRAGEVVDLDHVGSANSDVELAVLMEVAADRLRPGQDALDLGQLDARPTRMQDVADFTLATPAEPAAESPVVTATPGAARTVSTSSVLLWQVLLEAYSRVGLDVLEDEAFRAMALARIVDPTSKADSPRVLAGLGAPAPSDRTLYRALRRCHTREYRAKSRPHWRASPPGRVVWVSWSCMTSPRCISRSATKIPTPITPRTRGCARSG